MPTRYYVRSVWTAVVLAAGQRQRFTFNCWRVQLWLPRGLVQVNGVNIASLATAGPVVLGGARNPDETPAPYIDQLELLATGAGLAAGSCYIVREYMDPLDHLTPTA